MAEKLYNKDYLKELETVLGKTFKRSIEIINPMPNEYIADIGCGIGSLSFALAEKGASVFGIDNDEIFLEHAKANNQKTTPVTYLLCEADNVNATNESFNKVIFHRVFQHLPNYENVLAESKRILKQNGIIHIVEPDYLSATFFSENIEFERKLINTIAKERIPNSHKVRTLPSLLRSIGFNILSIEVHNYIFNSFTLANYLINFDDNVNREFKAGNFSENHINSWNKIKSLPDNCFNFSMNMILITAQKTE
jgi:ubiquinone/menaquinone biosynthesis C-methylase UbiE